MDEQKRLDEQRQLKILGIIITTLLLPLIMNIANQICIEVLWYNFEIKYDDMPIALSSVSFMLLGLLLWIVFKKTKEVYLEDAVIAGVCAVSVLFGAIVLYEQLWYFCDSVY